MKIELVGNDGARREVLDLLGNPFCPDEWDLKKSGAQEELAEAVIRAVADATISEEKKK